MSFIKTKAETIHEKVEKVEGRAEANRYFNYPYEAIEEAVANAVYHKGYDLGEPIEIQILPDKIYILSHPAAVPPVTDKMLKEKKNIVARSYRNRRIGDFLKELELTEGRVGEPASRKFIRNYLIINLLLHCLKQMNQPIF